MNTYLFAYGSLMNPKSLALTLPGTRETHPATLRGFKRKANAPFDGYAYMNIVPNKESAVPGVLIPLSDTEFAYFSAREEGYAKVDVSSNIDANVSGTVYAFIAPDIECPYKVPRTYLNTCTAGMTDLERDLWIAETDLSEIAEDIENPVYEFHA